MDKGVVVREADRGDCSGLLDVHCPWARGLPRGERLRRCGWWADREACEFYLGLYRRLGGEVLVAVAGGTVAGEAELLPHDDCLLGPSVYINVLWVRGDMRRRGVGRRLVEAAAEWAQGRGYSRLDVIPEDGSEGFYAKMGFTRRVEQVKAVKPLERGSGGATSHARSLGLQEAPEGMALVAGVYRPGLYTWYTAWLDTYTRAWRPQAYQLGLDGEPVVLLDPFSEGRASIIAWTRGRPDPGLLETVLAAAEELAVAAGVWEVFVQTWEWYEPVLARREYRVIDKAPWLSRRL
ncbi:GNAT family N-acetyltransferase [Pyrodictium abyssi]|uniref:N-acetyltransferase domain-containing protein n=1 Tax=Pyrodictium abyssi TaxID=54256 RepID=A0ABN6ZN37_9CREN|nr:hypothetical protein PABY_11910 [Pyrodictium abyssi]